MPLEAYESLPENDSDVFDVIITGGMLVVPGLEPYRADVYPQSKTGDIP